MKLPAGSYWYRYDASGSFERTPDGGYDDATRAVMLRNASASMEMDPLRATLAPSAPQLRGRIVRLGRTEGLAMPAGPS